MIEICPSHIYRNEPEDIPEEEFIPELGDKWGYCYNHWCVNRSWRERDKGKTLESGNWRIPRQEDFIELFDSVGEPDKTIKVPNDKWFLNEDNGEYLLAKASNLMAHKSVSKHLKTTNTYPEFFYGWRVYDEDTKGTNSSGFNLYPAQTRDRKGVWQNVITQQQPPNAPAVEGYGTFGMLWSREAYVKYPTKYFKNNTYANDIMLITIPVAIATSVTLELLEIIIFAGSWNPLLAGILFTIGAIIVLINTYFYKYSVGGAAFFKYETNSGMVNIKEGNVPSVFDSSSYMFGYVSERAGGGASIRLVNTNQSYVSKWKVGDKYIDGSGREYETTKIGNQVWLASNLRTFRWVNGKRITRRDKNGAWFSRGESRLATYSVHPS